ncbi:CDP-alcohol phosphatidyltransferase family protein [Sphingomonas sp. F9_3S_D5_B_2]
MNVEIGNETGVRLWGLTNSERIRRLAQAAGLEPGTGARDVSLPTLWADAGYAFDPAWFQHIATQPGSVLVVSGRPVLANLPAGVEPDQALTAPGLTAINYDDRPTLYNRKLRKRECPFVEPLRRSNSADIERLSYYGAYKGVTDILTKYLWPEMALALTQLAARAGMTPNMVTGIGATLCVVATVLFAFGWYWTGLACGFVFMVLDTVDGKLARCTVTSSWWGNIFDHGIDIVHPPFWWIAWGVGTAFTPHPLRGETLTWVMVAIVVSYVVQRLIEGFFVRRFGFHIHVWRRFDTNFRLITARRNPNMLILFVSLAGGRPDLGLIVVAWWTVLSLLVHCVQLVQALVTSARSGPITTWMETQP